MSADLFKAGIIDPANSMLAPGGATVAPPSQPLWRLVLVGLGPLGALVIFAVLMEVSRVFR
jgi:hypothetical protein